MLHDILGHDHLQRHPQLIRHYTNLWTYYRIGPYYRFWPYYQIWGGFHRTLQRARLANRGHLLLRTLGPVPFGTFICSNVEIILSWTCHVYGPFEFRTSLGTSILLSCVCVWLFCGIKNFQQIHVVGIPMGKNCFPLLADIFLYPSIRSGIATVSAVDEKKTQ